MRCNALSQAALHRPRYPAHGQLDADRGLDNMQPLPETAIKVAHYRTFQRMDYRALILYFRGLFQ
jgi:hypothetical protein